MLPAGDLPGGGARQALAAAHTQILNSIRCMKKLLVGAALALAGLLIVTLILFLSLGSLVKKGVETIGPRLTQVEVRLDGARLFPWSGRGQLTGLFVGNPPGYKTPSAIQVGEIALDVQVPSLWSDKVVIRELHLVAPEITFEGGLSGNNLSTIMANVEQASGGGAPPADQPASQRRFEVQDLLIKDAKIHVSLTGLAGKTLSVALPEIHLTGIGAEGDGVLAAELTKRVLKELVAAATKAATGAAGDLTKGLQDAGKQGVEQLEKAGKGLTDLFKKKTE